MDPYLRAEALDKNNSFYSRKLSNLEISNKSYSYPNSYVDALPSKIILQTTQTCNLNCIFCQIDKKQKNIHMQKEIFDKVADELFPTLIEMHPSNIGEPLMWKYFDYMCKKIEEYGVLLDLTTNGTLLNKKNIDNIENIARDVKISFDGAQKKTFEKLRKGAVFENVIENVKQLVQRIGSKKHRVISFQMTLMKSNFNELPELIELANKIGINKVKGYHLFSFKRELDKESLMFYMDDYEKILAESIILAQELGINLELAEPVIKKEKYFLLLKAKKCHLPWHESWIDINGNVYPCHSNHGLSIGNIKDTKFINIWNNNFYKSIRNGMIKNKPIWKCKGCGMLFEKNEEHQQVPYDPENFLSPEYRIKNNIKSKIRWSGRMKPFDLNERSQ